MTLLELISAFRYDEKDEGAPPRWSNEGLTAYANEAEREAADRALLLLDVDTDDVAVYAITTSNEVEIPKSVVKVESAKFTPTGGEAYQLRVIDRSRLIREVPGWEDVTTPTYLMLWAGKAYIVGEQQAGTLNLEVYRLPAEDLADDSDEPEINERYHLDLLHWVKHRAYLRRDIDAYDKDKSDFHLGEFERVFGPKRNAKSANSRHGAVSVYVQGYY